MLKRPKYIRLKKNEGVNPGLDFPEVRDFKITKYDPQCGTDYPYKAMPIMKTYTMQRSAEMLSYFFSEGYVKRKEKMTEKQKHRAIRLLKEYEQKTIVERL